MFSWCCAIASFPFVPALNESKLFGWYPSVRSMCQIDVKVLWEHKRLLIHTRDWIISFVASTISLYIDRVWLTISEMAYQCGDWRSIAMLLLSLLLLEQTTSALNVQSNDDHNEELLLVHLVWLNCCSLYFVVVKCGVTTWVFHLFVGGASWRPHTSRYIPKRSIHQSHVQSVWLGANYECESNEW